MFWKVYHHLHPLSKGKTSFLQKIEKNCNLHIFKMVVNINELLREHVNQKLYIPKISSGCKRHQVHFNEMAEEI
jgi:hypothetical protein